MNNAHRRITRFSIALASACFIAALTPNPVTAQDKAKAPAAPAKAPAKDERDRKVFVENEKVLVSEVRYKPGASSGMLERNERVTRALTDGTLEKTYKDGKKETITWKAGDVKYNPKETYSQKNTGKTELVLYTVSIKK
jgi:hypothetical protein